MSSEDIRALVRRFYTEVSRGNLAIIDELCAPNFVDHDPTNPSGNLAGVKAFFTVARAAFSDLRFATDDVIVEGDKAVVRFTMRGTQRGEFMGISPTGKQVTVTGMDLVRFAGGKAVEHWGEFDSLGLLQQLGAIPTGPQPEAPGEYPTAR